MTLKYDPRCRLYVGERVAVEGAVMIALAEGRRNIQRQESAYLPYVGRTAGIYPICPSCQSIIGFPADDDGHPRYDGLGCETCQAIAWRCLQGWSPGLGNDALDAERYQRWEREREADGVTERETAYVE